jgi:hypothetical protein
MLLSTGFFLQADIVLRGYRGWNTRRALEVLENIFPKVCESQRVLVDRETANRVRMRDQFAEEFSFRKDLLI